MEGVITVGVALAEKLPRAECVEGRGPCEHPETGSGRPAADSVPSSAGENNAQVSLGQR